MTTILLETTRLLLRCPEKSDQQELERFFCNPHLMRYLGGLWIPKQRPYSAEHPKG